MVSLANMKRFVDLGPAAARPASARRRIDSLPLVTAAFRQLRERARERPATQQGFKPRTRTRVMEY